MRQDTMSALQRQAFETLRRARATPRGTLRNDLRQLANALRGLERQQAKPRNETEQRFDDRLSGEPA